MIVDSSVILAIFLDEPEAGEALGILQNADHLEMSAGTLMECSVVIKSRLGQHGLQKLHALLEASGIDIVAATAEHAEIAEVAFAKYGKGQGHPAQLNFGDLFAYALSKETGDILFCKGKDFPATDLRVQLLDG